MFAKLKEYAQTIVIVVAAISLVAGGLSYFAKAEDLKMVQYRLDQKIASDQYYDTQKRIWALEDRNKDHGSECVKWPDERDRMEYRELQVRLETLKGKLDSMQKK